MSVYYYVQSVLCIIISVWLSLEELCCIKLTKVINSEADSRFFGTVPVLLPVGNQLF